MNANPKIPTKGNSPSFRYQMNNQTPNENSYVTGQYQGNQPHLQLVYESTQGQD